jgi:hypothetical protein
MVCTLNILTREVSLSAPAAAKLVYASSGGESEVSQGVQRAGLSPPVLALLQEANSSVF